MCINIIDEKVTLKWKKIMRMNSIVFGTAFHCQGKAGCVINYKQYSMKGNDVA